MKADIHAMNVLVIHAPGHHPACLPRRGALAASNLASLVQNLYDFDAGTDFLRQVVMDPDSLMRLSWPGPGKPADIDPRDSRNDEIQSIVPAPDWANLPEVLMRLQSPDGSRPEMIIDDLKSLDRALEIVSTAFHPVRLYRDGCSFPGLDTIDDLLAFRSDSGANPFYRYAMEQWDPFVSSRAPDIAVLSVGSAGQIPAAATLAAAWHLRWPDIPLLGIGIDDLSAAGKKELFYEDRLSSEAAGLHQLANQPAKTETVDSAGLPEVDTVEASAGLPNDPRPILELPLIAERIPDYVRTAVSQGRKLIIWRPVSGEVGSIGRRLHAAARQGIWNHLILERGHAAEFENFARSNAGIVHSWCRLEPALSAYSDPVCRYPSAAPAYGETVPMPGYPLWMAIRDPVVTRTCLAHFDTGALSRMRVRDDGHSLFEVGRNLQYRYVRPQDLPGGYLEEIVRMVAAGGSVNLRYVKYNLERAYLIAYAEEEGVIVGNSSLKHPRDEYIDAVSRQSGIDLHHFLERGYTSVRPEYRGLGIGAQLLAGLTERAGDYKIFSIIAEDNIATQKMAIRNHTRRVATFFSQRADKQVSVWIPEWMLPEGMDLPEQPDV